MQDPVAPAKKSAPFAAISVLVVPLVVLIVSLVATMLLWHLVEQGARDRAEFSFGGQIEEITGRLLSRLKDNENVLLGGNALFSVHGEALTREQWHLYASSLQPDIHNPGILGFGYAAWIAPEQRTTHIQAIQAEGFPGYTITPEGERPVCTAIVWLEPFNELNRRAFGYDMYSEPVRRAAMERARNTGKTSISGKIVLVQEAGEANSQGGILMYLPSYRRGMPTETVAQRQAALRGFVYSPIRMHDFVRAALVNMPAEVDFDLYSGQSAQPERLLFSSRQTRERMTPADYAPRFSVARTIEAYGASWHFLFTSRPSFDAEFSHEKSLFMLFGGVLLSCLLSTLVFMQGRARRQAQVIAEQMARRVAAQQKLALHVQQTPLAVIEWDESFRVTAWNHSAEEIFGYTAEEAFGRDASFIIPDSAREQVKTVFQKVRSESGGQRSTNQNLTKDGRIIECEWSNTPLVDGRGNFIGAASLAQDITERRRAEEALLRERNLLQSVMDGTRNSHLAYLDRDFKFVRVNVAFAASCGYPPQEMIGKNHFDLYPDAENEAIFKQVRETGEAFEARDKPFEYPDQPERGLTWWDWALSPVKNERGEVIGLVLSLFDITGRKKMEQALQTSEARFRLMFEQHSAIMLLIDPDSGRILDANKAAAAFYGYARDTLRTMTIDQINCQSREETAAVRQQIQDRTLSNFTVNHRLADGIVRTVDVHAAPICFQDQLINFAIIYDVTERQRAEAERERLEAQNRQLQKSESLGRMAGAIAHHFNNQLQAVMMSLEMTLGGLDDPARYEEIRTYVHTALRAAGKASAVSKLLLTYLGQTPGTYEQLDLARTCRNSQPMLLAGMPSSMEFRLNAPQSGPMIKAVENQIQQLLVNLITNAWEACANDRGVVTLTIKTVTEAAIPARHRYPIDCQPPAQPYACIEVTDTGSGIVEADIDRLFDPFFTSKFTGRGMGLAVVLGIARAHKGVVAVESGPAQGSTFRVFLPVDTAATPTAPLPELPLPEAVGSGTILIVDDEPVSRRLVARMLQSFGYTVLEAENGEQAVDMFERHAGQITVVLCDVIMPRMNGWETLAALRRRSPELPVILASGYSESQVMEGDHDDMPQAFLEKPYRFAKLKETLARVMLNGEKQPLPLD